MMAVGVGTGALGPVIGKLATLLGNEYTMLKSVRKDIEFLERELRRMQILVNVLADMERLDEVSKDWKGSMRDLSYDMECIDRFMLHLDDGDVKHSFPKKAARRLKTLFARHGIGTQIKELKARVAEDGERKKRLNLDNFASSSTKLVAIDPRLSAFHGVARGLVAMDGCTNQVVSWLTEETVELKVVAIVGGGGLGKTYLAMEVYRKIGGHFQCQASLSVSRTPDLEKLLKDVLSQIDEAAYNKCQLERWEKDQLIRQIQRILTGKRYRITELPEDIGNLQNLETLDLRGTLIPKLPSTITRLHKLVCLFGGNKSLFVFSADMFGSTRALEEVLHICQVDNPEKFSEEIGHLKKLRKISMSSLWRSGMDPHVLRCYRERLESSLNELVKHNLQHLCTDGEMGECLFRGPCCTFPPLQELKLVGYMEKVPKGMASLTNILQLQIEVRQFDEEGLHILMRMPSLAYLQLGVFKSDGVVTVSSNGFKLLEVFHYRIYEGKATGIEFAVGAMPALRRLLVYWRAYLVNYGTDMGIKHLSSLAHLQVETDCWDALPEEAAAAEGSVEKAIALHLNRHTLQLHFYRIHEDMMFDDTEEREKEKERRLGAGQHVPWL